MLNLVSPFPVGELNLGFGGKLIVDSISMNEWHNGMIRIHVKKWNFFADGFLRNEWAKWQ